VTHLRKLMLEELQGRKSMSRCLARFRPTWWFDSVPEGSQFADHLPGAQLLRSFGKPWTAFFVTHPLMQDQPYQAALSMGDGSDCLIVSEARDHPAVHNLKSASFGAGSGIRNLIE
jgi:hypothetical protein